MSQRITISKATPYMPLTVVPGITVYKISMATVASRVNVKPGVSVAVTEQPDGVMREQGITAATKTDSRNENSVPTVGAHVDGGPIASVGNRDHVQPNDNSIRVSARSTTPVYSPGGQDVRCSPVHAQAANHIGAKRKSDSFQAATESSTSSIANTSSKEKKKKAKKDKGKADKGHATISAGKMRGWGI